MKMEEEMGRYHKDEIFPGLVTEKRGHLLFVRIFIAGGFETIILDYASTIREIRMSECGNFYVTDKYPDPSNIPVGKGQYVLVLEISNKKPEGDRCRRGYRWGFVPPLGCG